MGTYITICKIDSQGEFAVWLRKLKQGLCINLEGWDGITNSMDMNLGKLCGDGEGQAGLVCYKSMGLRRIRHNLATEQQCMNVYIPF